MKVPYFDMRARIAPLEDALIEAFVSTLGKGTFCLGPDVEAFEKRFAEFSGAKHCVALSSGTAALHVALRCLDIGPGDEVITCPMTFAATCWAISYVGATPIFVDADPEHCTLDASKLEQALSPRTKAVVPIHLYGQVADMDAIRDICVRRNVAIVEDAAQAHGAQYKGRTVGSLGSAMTCFSFYPGKNLGALGEGGALVTDDAEHAARARRLREHGSRERYVHEEIGFNYRMDGIQGAGLGRMLPCVPEWNAKRRAAAARYGDLLTGTPLTLPREAEYADHIWHIYSIRCERRDELRRFLDECGIGCGLHYPIPMHLQPCYEDLGHKRGDFPVAESIGDHCLSLPMFPEITVEQQQYIADMIADFFGRCS